jgi:ABC-type glycerol-3-phosphate transport system substrate-binding protein
MVLFIGLLLPSLTLANAQIRLTTASWPFPLMPSQEEQEANPSSRAYAAALQAWLEQNPEVDLQQIEVNLWDQQSLLTAVAGGVAPAWYPGQVMGGWNDYAVRTAMVQGLMADVTEEMERYGIGQNLAEPLQPLWRERWEVDGRYYGLPISYGITMGVYYRKDLIRELGLEEPQPGWTWDEFRALAKALTTDTRKGAVMQNWLPSGELGTNGFNTMVRVPAPETPWNWRWDYTSNIDLWTSIIERWREAMYEDQSIIMEPAGLNDGQVTEIFLREDAAMMFNNAGWYTRKPTDPSSMSTLADRLGKPIEEVIGWVELPRGELDTLSSSTTFFFFLSFNPDLSPAELDKAVSLFDFMFYDEGAVIQQQVEYEASQDLRFVFNEPVPIHGRTEIDGIPGSITDAWGEEYMAHVDSALAIPQLPPEAAYFPVQTETGPGGQAFADAMNTLIFTSGSVDIAQEFANAERTINQQAASFRSSVSDEAFTTGAREFYAALNAFYQEHTPEFYAQVFSPWYDAYVAPVLSE